MIVFGLLSLHGVPGALGTLGFISSQSSCARYPSLSISIGLSQQVVTVIITLSVPVQPVASVAVTVYIVVVNGDTVLLEPVPSELLHVYVIGAVPFDEFAVIVVELPEHIETSALV